MSRARLDNKKILDGWKTIVRRRQRSASPYLWTSLIYIYEFYTSMCFVQNNKMTGNLYYS